MVCRMSGDVDARVAGVRAAVDALAAALADRRERSEAWDELLPGMPGGDIGRDAVKAFLDEHVVDTAGAVELLGFASRTGLHYHVNSGALVPLARFGPVNVFWREDVARLKRDLHPDAGDES